MIHRALRTHNFKRFHFSLSGSTLRSAILTLKAQKTLLISKIDIGI